MNEDLLKIAEVLGISPYEPNLLQVIIDAITELQAHQTHPV